MTVTLANKSSKDGVIVERFVISGNVSVRTPSEGQGWFNETLIVRLVRGVSKSLVPNFPPKNTLTKILPLLVSSIESHSECPSTTTDQPLFPHFPKTEESDGRKKGFSERRRKEGSLPFRSLDPHCPSLSLYSRTHLTTG